MALNEEQMPEMSDMYSSLSSHDGAGRDSDEHHRNHYEDGRHLGDSSNGGSGGSSMNPNRDEDRSTTSASTTATHQQEDQRQGGGENGVGNNNGSHSRADYFDYHEHSQNEVDEFLSTIPFLPPRPPRPPPPSFGNFNGGRRKKKDMEIEEENEEGVPQALTAKDADFSRPEFQFRQFHHDNDGPTFLHNNNAGSIHQFSSYSSTVSSSSNLFPPLHELSSHHQPQYHLPPPTTTTTTWWSSFFAAVGGLIVTESAQAATSTKTDFLFSTSRTTSRILAHQSASRLLAESSLSVTQQRALAIVPKIGSSLSMPCSCFIIYEVIQDHRRGKATAVKRALLGMSVIDVLASSAWFLSTWAVPASSGFAYAVGNSATCNFQGFLLQLAVGAPLYNSSLALFYLLMIRMRWTKTQFEKSRIEWYVHGFILTFAIGTSILLLVLEQYNHIQAVCWVIGEPPDCGNSSRTPNPDVPCERGDYAWIYGMTLFYGPIWICVLCCTTSMFVLYNEVRKTHRRSRRYSTTIQGMSHSTNRSGRDTSRVATQAILYSLSFLITWMPSTLWSIAHWFNWSHYGLDLFAAAAEPLQGFWNLLVFLMGRRQIPLLCRLLNPCCSKLSLYQNPESSTLDNSSSQRRRVHTDDRPAEPKSRRSMESMLRSINQGSSHAVRFGSSVVQGSDLLDVSARQTPIGEDIDHSNNNNSTLQDAMAVATELAALENDEVDRDANTNNANAAEVSDEGVTDEDEDKNKNDAKSEETADADSRSTGAPTQFD
eukprot:CAMPEP_0113460720 /NCGR_PEP_ID=MMETSP0014_2-20120614/11142_1 /TAXON_ID=2857 /ORGANISM="Nitzschia sp." /LENGTH=767 /DNA_ID=CAMNT_0000352401 /DNA_START=184 /DNA_END=2485 /DNA_ORIENTATION=+ /assembly_acc=CAM_ASM_000159